MRPDKTPKVAPTMRHVTPATIHSPNPTSVWTAASRDEPLWQDCVRRHCLSEHRSKFHGTCRARHLVMAQSRCPSQRILGAKAKECVAFPALHCLQHTLTPRCSKVKFPELSDTFHHKRSPWHVCACCPLPSPQRLTARRPLSGRQRVLAPNNRIAFLWWHSLVTQLTIQSRNSRCTRVRATTPSLLPSTQIGLQLCVERARCSSFCSWY